uniref:V-type proton ATPase subunit C n=1 Tax=Haptolina brevifila TaxID=156173 RepID=A0A7S2IAX8_9EUKA|mmetsp:Transcript_63723/g.125979  ORF Transcript_63723/g.125979 Transcript_63723/m.125979 type:complete len:380 (+) Transcript_63723:43-1182(+)
MPAMETQLWGIATKYDYPTLSEIKKACEDLGVVSPWEIKGKSQQHLRIGTLDSLMSLSDDLQKMETLGDATVSKFYKQLVELDPNDEPTINGLQPSLWTTIRWEWDEAKLQMKTPLKELCERISLGLTSLDDELKTKMTEMNTLKASLQQAERKTQGNLMVRGLADVVREDDLVNSDYMMTCLTVVPKLNMKDFENTYHTMAKHVVPQSCKLLAEDSEYALYRVIIFKKFLDEYKTSAREKRYSIRDFVYNAATQAEEASKKFREEQELGEVKKMLAQWCKVNYAESYSMLVHLKAARVFVESVLRFGLRPTMGDMIPDYKSCFIQPMKGKTEQLRKALSGLFPGAMIDGEEESSVPGASGEFYPYVYTCIETEPNVQA